MNELEKFSKASKLIGAQKFSDTKQSLYFDNGMELEIVNSDVFDYLKPFWGKDPDLEE